MDDRSLDELIHDLGRDKRVGKRGKRIRARLRELWMLRRMLDDYMSAASNIGRAEKLIELKTYLSECRMESTPLLGAPPVRSE